MRIAFFGQSGPYAPVVLRLLLAAERPSSEIALVVEGHKLPRGRSNTVLRKPSPRPLPDTTRLGDLAVAAGLPTLETCDINGAEAVAILGRFAIDLIVCVGFDRLFRPEVLAAARRGGINAHPSRLPRWRGPSPLFWALKNCEREIGISLHALDEKEDHGVIYAQESFVRPRRATGEELYTLAGRLAGRMLLDSLARADTGTLVGVPQDHAKAIRAPRPTSEDVFVNPTDWGCEALVDFCSGAPFFRTPWMRLGDEVFFANAGLFCEPGRRLPGHYLQHGSELVVGCRDGLAHLSVQV